MSELFLVRHAQASFGEADYDRLSTLGHQQARWLGQYFRDRDLSFDRVICGDMVRHRETLDGLNSAISGVQGEMETNPQWNEFDFESLVEAYLNHYPQERLAPEAPRQDLFLVLVKAMKAWADDGLGDDVPESWVGFEQRVRDALSHATEPSSRNQKVLVVSSGGAISMAIRQILQAPAPTMIQMNLQTRNSSFSHLYFNQKGIALSGFNHIPHLDHPDRREAVTYY